MQERILEFPSEFAASFEAHPLPIAPEPTSKIPPQEFNHLYHLGRQAITKLYNSPPEDVSKYDIAEMNLISGRGLPGAEDLDITAILNVIDLCGKRCHSYIAQRTPHYHADPGKFQSLAKFQIRAMVQVLIRHLGVRYNPQVDGDPETRPEYISDPADTFIHGLLSPRRTGTCATLPVLLIAVGRRLGYPLKLVIAPEHTFCRWDSSEDRFNIEYDERGLSFPPDDHYKLWPFKWPPEVHEYQRKRPYFLLSLTPQQELAHFAFYRAYHLNLIETRRAEALAAIHVAQKYWATRTHATWITHLTTKALYPQRTWPRAPCEETAGRAAMERLVREKGAAFNEAALTKLI